MKKAVQFITNALAICATVIFYVVLVVIAQP